MLLDFKNNGCFVLHSPIKKCHMGALDHMLPIKSTKCELLIYGKENLAVLRNCCHFFKQHPKHTTVIDLLLANLKKITQLWLLFFTIMLKQLLHLPYCLINSAITVSLQYVSIYIAKKDADWLCC